jgi:hypothetical protein
MTAEQVQGDSHEVDEEGFSAVVALEVDLPLAPSQTQGVNGIEQLVSIEARGDTVDAVEAEE